MIACIVGPLRFHARCCEVGTWPAEGLWGATRPSRCDNTGGLCKRLKLRVWREPLRHTVALVRYVCLRGPVRRAEFPDRIDELETDLRFLQRGGNPAPGMSREANMQQIIGDLLQLRAG